MIGKGDVNFLETNDEIMLKNVFYVLGLTQNLLLVDQFVRNSDQLLIFEKERYIAITNSHL